MAEQVGCLSPKGTGDFLRKSPHHVGQKIGLFAAGALGARGFAPFYLWPLTAFSLGFAYWILCGRNNFIDGYKVGFWWGAGYGIANFHWCLESIFANAEIARQLWWLYPIGFVGIMLASGLLFGLPFAMAAWTNSRGWRRVVYFALAWTFVLWLREWFLTGFPWNPLANISLPYPIISGMMSVIGALGLTFILSGAICSVAEYAKTKSKWQFLFFVPLLCMPVIFNSQFPILSSDNNLNVRIVQPSFDMNQKFDKNQAANNLQKLIDMSGGAKTDLIVWPETAYPYLINKAIKMPALGAPLFAGAVYYEDGKIYNAMVASSDGGNVINKYFKSHLVPFGEYRPFGDIIPTPGQLESGAGPAIIPFWQRQIVPAICYEIVFSDSLIPAGANPNFIINITNDAWFGRSWGPYQHLDMARRQAIETGLPVIRAAHSGISAIIDANGRVVKSLPLFEVGVLDGQIPQARITIYRRIGLNGIMLAIILLCIIPFALAKGWIFCRRQKRRGSVFGYK
jgi:apolipoprotein N-acyltransferase